MASTAVHHLKNIMESKLIIRNAIMNHIKMTQILLVHNNVKWAIYVLIIFNKYADL